MRIAAIVCFVLASLGTVSAVNTVMRRASEANGSGAVVSYAIGAFLVPLGFAIAGFMCWGKAQESKRR